MTSGDSGSSAVVNDAKRSGATPDASAAGFLDHAPNPLRYDGQPNDPDEVVGVLSSLIPQGSRVLDIGCGTGSVSIQLIGNRGLSLIGVEPDEERAQRARERGVTVRAARLSPELIAELGSFDVVLFADVLEHLPDPHSLLSLATSALRPGGRVVASVPNVAHWSVRTELLRGRFVYRDSGIMDATHLRWFTRAVIRQLFESAHLRVEDVRPTAGFELQCYSEVLPWRRMKMENRNRIIRRAIRHWPTLFACQWAVSGIFTGPA